MKHLRIIICWIILFSLISILPIEDSVILGSDDQKNIFAGEVHNIDKDTYYDTIQDGVNDADPGNTLEVASGVFLEHVVVNTPVNIFGDNRNSIIDGSSVGTTLNVLVPNVNISGFTFRNTGSGYTSPYYEYDAGVEIDWTTDVTVSNCDFIDIPKVGVLFHGANANIIIQNCTFQNVQMNGIRGQNGGGMHIGQYNNKIINNVYDTGAYGIVFYGVEFRDTIISNNTFSSYSWNDISISQVGYNFLPGNCNFNIISDNKFLTTMEDHALYISSSYDQQGMFSIFKNDFSNSLEIHLTYQSRIYQNNFYGTYAYDDSLNQWDNGYPSGGNYWSDYAGLDDYYGPNQNILGSDGMGDTNYTAITGGASVDEYPLMVFFEYTEYDIPVQQGWNLLSLPVRQLNWSIDSVLESIAGKWDYIMTYDEATSTWKSNNINRPASLNDLTVMNHLRAYWINITEPGVTLTVKGDFFNSTLSIPLYTGWNLIGYPSLVEKTISEALVGTGYDMPVEGFNASDPYHISPLADSYMMKPGEGYWVHVPADTVWVVDW